LTLIAVHVPMLVADTRNTSAAGVSLAAELINFH